tara:strand:- start:144 stop:461 length:318 start_codon:yes stop_codon:yes gene_type:complete
MASRAHAHRNRFLITTVILATFFLIMMGIGAAILGDGESPTMNQEWKEILLLILGAFLGSYSRVVDFWFNGNDTDMDGKPDAITPPTTPSELCDKCGDEMDYDNF